ncbi:MAG: ATP-binding protein, partial [Planctomycetota bacterium]|nr:ATP-binding protein [Planctomycetota bacterium]
NLVGNSCKFLPQGGIVQISAEMKGSDVLVQVEDSGDGVPGEQRELVFNKFRQGNSDGLTEKPQGTGLGLAICREIVEHMGGRIWCRESDLGGALFAFTLPVSETVVG